jgi:hypothetical protein
MGIPLPREREFEEVIMVEVQIEEMFGSDRSRPKRLQTSRGHRRRAKEHNERMYSSEWAEKYAHKRIDRADVVRDVWFSDVSGLWPRGTSQERAFGESGGTAPVTR